MLTVVTHHTDINPAEQSPLFVQDYGKFDLSPAEMISMLGDSARILGCKTVLLTDSRTEIETDFEVVRYDLPETRYRGVNHHRMYARTKFCETAPEGDYIFCDYDVLLNAIPEMDFHMGITIRKVGSEAGVKTKVQEGVMYCSDIHCAHAYFGAIYDRINNGSPTEKRDWGGTQDAAINMLWPIYEREQENPVTWRDWKIRLLPYQEYNRSPGPHGLEDEDVFAWHFKGARRKQLMRKYYERIMRHGQDRASQGRPSKRVRLQEPENQGTAPAQTASSSP